MSCAGAKLGLCELPRDFISSKERGGTGGTCVLRGCVPKKLMAIAGLFREDMQDAEGYGSATLLRQSHLRPSVEPGARQWKEGLLKEGPLLLTS